MAVVMATPSHPPFPLPSSPSISFSFALKSIQMHLNATVGTVKMQYAMINKKKEEESKTSHKRKNKILDQIFKRVFLQLIFFNTSGK